MMSPNIAKFKYRNEINLRWSYLSFHLLALFFSLLQKRITNQEVNCMNKILLIVEDEEDMQELMKKYIKKAGLDVEVHSAYDGKEGVQKYKELMEGGKKPDLVIMDLKLPEMDGVEATKKIKEIDENATVYGFTAFFDTDWSEKLLEAGAKKIIPRYVGFEGFVKEIIKFFKK